MFNVAGKLIRKWFKMDGVFHCVVQDLNGKIYHERFTHEQDAIDFLESFNSKPEFLNIVK